MSKYLYVKDAGSCSAIADDTPQVRAWLAEIDDLWEAETPPITITELELEAQPKAPNQ